MKTGLASLIVLSSLAFGLPAASLVADAPKRAEPTLAQRVADLEAYINNGARVADSTTNVTSKLGSYDEKTGRFAPSPGPGHNGWVMTSAALVLFMTLPGLALFYGGLVRRKNVLSVLAQCLGLAGLVTILWYSCGYSLVFGDVGGEGADAATIFGSLTRHAFFHGVDAAPNPNYAAWVSHNVFAIYQLMFAIITPALIIGAIAERMKFAALLLFMGLWMFLVYFPLAHMVWGIDGFMNGVWNPHARIKAIDFAGGTVVHMSSGWSALVLCLILGKRLGFPKEPMPPHSMVLCMVGTGMLWVGWYGFNAGSALAADGVAATAFTCTTLATAVASFTWAMMEYALKGKPSVLGFCSGAVAGLVVITPACGFVWPSGAVAIGLLAGVIPFLAVAYLKAKLGYDDALDTFGVHAVGGTLGAFMTGLQARTSANANLAANLRGSVTDSLLQPLAFEQLKAILVTVVLAVAMTALIALGVRALVGLRPSEEIETLGLDLVEHGEEGYHGG